MKLAPRFALLTLAAALAVAVPAAAQDRQGSVEITPVIGGTFGGTFDSGTLAFYNGEAKAAGRPWKSNIANLPNLQGTGASSATHAILRP